MSEEVPENPIDKLLREQVEQYKREKAQEEQAARDAARQTRQTSSGTVNTHSNVAGIDFRKLFPGCWDKNNTPEAPSSPEVDRVHALWDEIPIKRIMDEILHVRYKDSRNAAINSGHSYFQCPDPAHPDEHASASANHDKDVWSCHKCCHEKTDKAALLGFAWGYPVPIRYGVPDAWEIKKRAVLELVGYDYDLEREKAQELNTPLPPAPPGVVAPDVTTPDPNNTEETDEADVWSDWDREVERAARRQQIQIEGRTLARARIDEREFVPPKVDVLNLEEEMQIPLPAVKWTIEGLHSLGGNTTIMAQYKTGKTTLMMNLVKSLADHTLFLNEFQTRELSGNILYINQEVSRAVAQENFMEMGIVNPRRIYHLALEGQKFNIMSDQAVEWLASTYLRPFEIEVLILDPFVGFFKGLDENSNTDVTAWTDRIDEIKFNYGVSDFFLPVHMGRNGEKHARGATRLDDWPDSRWNITRGEDQDHNTRYFEANGRRVDFAPTGLVFDSSTQKLSLDNNPSTSSPKSAASTQAARLTRDAVLSDITEYPGINLEGIYTLHGATSPSARKKYKEAVTSLLDNQTIVCWNARGLNGYSAKRYWLTQDDPGPNPDPNTFPVLT